ncbi:MAG: hypothetical protein DMF82_01635 [Acidobacteria bacterium]|nr:MAG: hypothetical protein DMF82_01635 [Acidobacteriota bacterium]
MAAAAGALLALVAVAALLVNLYFVSLMLGRWPRARQALSRLFNACGADTSSCAIVVATPYARLFGGAPNVAAGIPWSLAVLGLAAFWIATGRTVAVATVLVGAYLIYALVVVLRQPCPL